MISIIHLKRVLKNQIYWIAVASALVLLVCSVIYRDSLSGEKYTFLSLFYDEYAKEALKLGHISVENIILSGDVGYLWMFCPLIVSIPCIFTRKTERFLLFRTSKNKYMLSKYFACLVSGGSIVFIAYCIFISLCMLLVKENIWSIYIVKKLMSVFIWGVTSSVPGIMLAEFLENKYLILCIPFVLNYFMCSFVVNIIPYDIWKYISPSNYQILFFFERDTLVYIMGVILITLLGCAVIKKILLERRCDCGM